MQKNKTLCSLIVQSGILLLGIHRTAELQIAKRKKTFAMGSATMMPPVCSETLKKLVAIAATLLVVSACTEVPLEGSG
jgi:hypothetical protein